MKPTEMNNQIIILKKYISIIIIIILNKNSNLKKKKKKKKEYTKKEYKVKVHRSKRQCVQRQISGCNQNREQIVCIMHYHLYFCRSFTDESRNYLIDFIELSCRDHMFAAWRNTRKKLHSDTKQWIESRRS